MCGCEGLLYAEWEWAVGEAVSAGVWVGAESVQAAELDAAIE